MGDSPHRTPSREESSSLRHGQAAGGGVPGAASPPPRNLRGAEPAEGRRRRLSATTHSALPLEHGKSRGGGRRGDPNLPARGLSLTRQRVPFVRARRAKCSQTPALPRRLDAHGSARGVAAAAAQLQGAGFSRGKRPAESRALGEHLREVGGREKGHRARGACWLPAQKRSEGESSTERQRFS